MPKTEAEIRAGLKNLIDSRKGPDGRYQQPEPPPEREPGPADEWPWAASSSLTGPEAVCEDVECVGESDLALQLRQVRHGGVDWIPKAVLNASSNVTHIGEAGTLAVKLWFAERCGWV